MNEWHFFSIGCIITFTRWNLNITITEILKSLNTKYLSTKIFPQFFTSSSFYILFLLLVKMNSTNWPVPNVLVFLAELVEHCAALMHFLRPWVWISLSPWVHHVPFINIRSRRDVLKIFTSSTHNNIENMNPSRQFSLTDVFAAKILCSVLWISFGWLISGFWNGI